MKNGAAIHRGFVGNETVLSPRPVVNPVTGNPGSTTLSGDIDMVGSKADNSYHVIRNAMEGLATTAILDGFVITGGNANDSFDNELIGGMLNIARSGDVISLIRNCSFQGNSN